jgi:hypothetical protein
MAVTTALCNSYKLEALRGVHRDTDTYRIALIKSGAAGDVRQDDDQLLRARCRRGAGRKRLHAGGLALAGGVWDLAGDTAFIDWNDAVWTAASIGADRRGHLQREPRQPDGDDHLVRRHGPGSGRLENANFIVQIPVGSAPAKSGGPDPMASAFVQVQATVLARRSRRSRTPSADSSSRRRRSSPSTRPARRSRRRSMRR